MYTLIPKLEVNYPTDYEQNSQLHFHVITTTPWSPLDANDVPMKIPGGCIHTTSLFETPTQRRALDKTLYGTFLLVSSMYFKTAYVLHMSFTHM